MAASLAVPAVKGHRPLAKGFAPLDVDGTPLPSDGSGGPGQYGYAHCICGAKSPVLRTTRERKLWYTTHREKLAGITWT